MRYRAAMERERLEALIRDAFAGVRLDGGVSQRQALVIDAWGRGSTKAEYEALPLSEVTDDWTRIEASAIDGISHFDAKGLRYYLPALMLWLLDHYHDDSGTLTAIGTVSALAFSREDDVRSRAMYAIFSDTQRKAIATYLASLPELVDLDEEDTKRVSRSLDRYWKQFLPADA